jgi:hypothetical protein
VADAGREVVVEAGWKIKRFVIPGPVARSFKQAQFVQQAKVSDRNPGSHFLLCSKNKSDQFPSALKDDMIDILYTE